MIPIIIFSKNRAMQLDALLRSIEQYGSNQLLPYCLFTYSSEHEESYKILQKENIYNIFIQEYNFRADLLYLLRHLPCESVFLSTDDMMFYKDVGTIPNISQNEVFSLRLGHNTIVQDHIIGSRQPHLNIYCENNGILSWCPHNYMYPTNYSYSLAVDCHLINRLQLLYWLEQNEWKSTNHIEGVLQKYRHQITVLKSFKESVCVNIPSNVMSGFTKSNETNSIEQLNTLFLSGKRINIQKTFENVKVIGCYQNISLCME
jgi:hypothetical protein